MRLPNISKITFSPKSLDPYLYSFGLKVNAENRARLEQGPFQEPNEYLDRQWTRLRKLSKSNDPRFWKLADHLIRSSKSLRMLALSNVRPNWYKDYSEEKIYEELRRLNGICYRPDKCFEIIRTPIPKPDGGVRYINDPGIAYRLYLWMMNQVYGVWFNDRINESQHGHRKGKGSVTCWEDIMNEVDKYDYIYEFDYKKFHDLINRRVLMKALIRIGVPDQQVVRLINLQSAYCKGTDEQDPMRMQWEEWPNPNVKYHHFYKGVVQGSNLAAYMGLSVLEYLEVYSIPDTKYIGYADDGILFMKDPKKVKELEERLNSKETGVELKPEKSGWVKAQGKWLTNLRFVGMELEGESRTVFSRTHSGKHFKMEWERKSEYWETIKRHPELFKWTSSNKRDRWPTVLNIDSGRQYLGYLFSKLWSDKPYESMEVMADRKLKWIKGSLVDRIEMGLFMRWKNIMLISTQAYGILAEQMRESELSTRSKQTGRRKVKRSPNSDMGEVSWFGLDDKGTGWARKDPSKYLFGTRTAAPCPELLDRERQLRFYHKMESNFGDAWRRPSQYWEVARGVVDMEVEMPAINDDGSFPEDEKWW